MVQLKPHICYQAGGVEAVTRGFQINEGAVMVPRTRVFGLQVGRTVHCSGMTTNMWMLIMRPTRCPFLQVPVILLSMNALSCLHCTLHPALVQEAESSPYPVTCFRIPAVVQTDSGVILAFAEARINTCADCAELGIAMRRWA